MMVSQRMLNSEHTNIAQDFIELCKHFYIINDIYLYICMCVSVYVLYIYIRVRVCVKKFVCGEGGNRKRVKYNL